MDGVYDNEYTEYTRDDLKTKETADLWRQMVDRSIGCGEVVVLLEAAKRT